MAGTINFSLLTVINDSCDHVFALTLSLVSKWSGHVVQTFLYKNPNTRLQIFKWRKESRKIHNEQERFLWSSIEILHLQHLILGTWIIVIYLDLSLDRLDKCQTNTCTHLNNGLLKR